MLCEDLTNIIIFIITKVTFVLFGLQSKEVILYSYCPVGGGGGGLS